MSSVIGSQFPQPLTDFARTNVNDSGRGETFTDAFTSVIKRIDELQGDADAKVANLVGGNEQDVHSTMIAVEKADLSFQLMMQVRNKIVNAYQEIARMQF